MTKILRQHGVRVALEMIQCLARAVTIHVHIGRRAMCDRRMIHVAVVVVLKLPVAAVHHGHATRHTDTTRAYVLPIDTPVEHFSRRAQPVND